MYTTDRALSWALRRREEGPWQLSEEQDTADFVIEAFEEAGADVKNAGALHAGSFVEPFLHSGFTDVLDQVNRYTGEGLHSGDILLNTEEHAAIYLGGGYMIEADPEAEEESAIQISSYRNYPWDTVLRYEDRC